MVRRTLIAGAQRRLAASFLLVAAAHVVACGSSATTAVGPTPADKCQVTITGGQLAIAPAGGSGSIALAAAPECAWTASTSANWVTGLAPTSGQGNQEIKFQAAPNPAITPRQADISFNGAIARVTQAGASCAIEINPRRQTVPATGGSGSVSVSTLAGCTWTASSGASWLTVTSSASGSGPGAVSFTAAANTGPARAGTITIGGQPFVVSQQAAGAVECAFALKPDVAQVSAGGGRVTFSVQTAPACSWAAASNASWLSVEGDGTGAGTGAIAIRVAANNGGARSGTIAIGDQTFTVNQAGTGEAPLPPPACTFAIGVQALNAAAAAGSTSVTVQAPAGCAWTAVSSEPWLTIEGTASGTGNGAVTVRIAANTGAQRVGVVSIAGQAFTVTQAAACVFGIDPVSQSVPAAGGPAATVAVANSTGCAWTASTSVPWLSITNGASGSGNGTVAITVAANTGPPRAGVVTIAGLAHTINQAGNCTISIDPAGADLEAAGGAGPPIAVTAAAGCEWTAATAASWITITAGANGSGNGNVGYSVEANDAGPRTGTISVGSRTFTISQAGQCSYTVSPLAFTFSDEAADSDPVSIGAPEGCAWTAVSNAPWITVLTGASGSGNGTMTFSVAAHGGKKPRVGTLTVAGMTVTVTQTEKD